MKILYLISGLILTLAPAGLQGTMTVGTNHKAPSYRSPASCSNAIDSAGESASIGAITGKNLTLVSWNIEKGINEGWLEDLKQLGDNAQLVLLQEAINVDEMKNAADAGVYYSFSPGFQTARYNSGIMTLSRTEPDLLCTLQNHEPWLRTPKITSISRFPIENDLQSLLLVNIHQINFSFGNKDYHQQLLQMADILNNHEGPIILSGDFNTWKESRFQLLKNIAQDLELEAVDFTPDQRKSFMGNPLDHIYVRGFDVRESYTVEVESSDHNPMIITLDLQNG